MRRPLGLSRKLYRALVSGMVRRRTITLEWFLACMTTVVGAWVFIVLGIALAFGRSVRFLPVVAAVAACFLLTGSLGVWALTRGRPGESRSTENLNQCRRSMFVTALLWALLTVLSGLSRPFGLYWPILAGFVPAAVWCYSRLYLRFKDED